MFSDMNFKLVSILRERGKRQEKSTIYKYVDVLILEHEFFIGFKISQSFSCHSKNNRDKYNGKVRSRKMASIL